MNYENLLQNEYPGRLSLFVIIQDYQQATVFFRTPQSSLFSHSATASILYITITFIIS